MKDHAPPIDAATHGLDPREQLSALIDGALSGDQARFLMRRLAHDPELVGRWERWQLAGDVLRGRAPVALPADFAGRVAEGLGESRAALATGWRNRGLGLALAASVAAVAVFVAWPLADGEGPALQPSDAVSVLPAIEVPFDPGAAVARSTATAAVDAVTVPDPAEPSTRAGSASGPVRSTPAPVADPAGPLFAGESPAGASPLPGADAPVGSPFSTPVATDPRPWPRAVLPGVPAAASFTAGHEGLAPVPDANDARPFQPIGPEATDEAPGTPPPR